jgi:DNA polymerase III subunit gamma/tau
VAYVSLYRKFRPQTFSDVVGQEHVVRTLVHAIEEDRLHHAYLFTGPRGTGKTSTARILAKAVNCEQGPTPTPCNECGSCTAITDGSSVDVIELDMASHGGVDDARELRDRALFAPAGSRRKVYILDEVHMASTAAFNALLKLVEEPPSHILFAMATTDPQKVIPTILSRVQRLDLRRVAATELGAHVRAVCAAEGATIEDGAVETVVRAGDGSVRDTLSVLEQVVAFAGAEVTAHAVEQVLGLTPGERVAETVERLAARDLAGLLSAVQGLLDAGYDLRRFTLDLVQHLRDLLVLQAAPDRPDLVDATDERRRLLLGQTRLLPSEAMLRAVEVLAETVAEQRQGSPRLPLELALARLAVPGADGDVSELADRVARLEATATRTSPARAASETASAWRAAPSADMDVAALDADAARPDAHAVPPDAHAAPPDAHAVPPDAHAAPPDAHAVPPDAHAAPPDAHAVPPDAHAVPPDAHAVPPDAHAAPPVADAGSSDGDAVPPPDEHAVPPDAHETATAASPAAEDPVASVGASIPAEQEPSPGGGEPAADDGGPATVGSGDALARISSSPASESAAFDLDGLRDAWPGVLELVRQRSRRMHAIIEPAVLVALGDGILTMRYAKRYASFHAANARKGEAADALRAAIRQATGLSVRLDVRVEGEDERRRPTPPLVTPADARTPVLDRPPPVGRPTRGPRDAAQDGASPADRPSRTDRDTGEPRSADVPSREPHPSPEEQAEVREAEAASVPPPDPEDVDALLAAELDARLVDEQPPLDA